MKMIAAIIIPIVVAVIVLLHKAWDLAGFIVKEFEQWNDDGKDGEA